MKLLSIDASPKQLSRLRNGHAVRVKKGTGFNLLVDPSKFDAINRSFTRGSAYQLTLSPDELMANKQAVQNGEVEGMGIYTGGRINIGKAFKSFGRQAERGLKKAGRTIDKGLKTAGKKTLKGLETAERAVRKNPVARNIVKKVLPIVAEKGIQALSTYAGLDPMTAKVLSTAGKEGTTAGLTEAGYGLYAGRGMSGGLLPGPPSRMPEVSSIAVGGNLLAKSNSQLPPALQSQAMSANFHMNTQLPPAYQRGGVRFV